MGALDFTLQTSSSNYLDLVAKDIPLAGWIPGYYNDDNNIGNIQVVKNYYGQRMDIPLPWPEGTFAGRLLYDGC